MAKGLSIDLTGLAGLKKAIASKEKDLVEGVDAELTSSTLDINAAQKRYAPVDQGTMRSSIGFDVKKPLEKSNFTAGAGSSYAPYQEFGTGGLVEVPAGLEEVAIQFKGAGKRKVNMKPQPFFFRALFEQRPKLIANLKNLLSK